MGGGTLAAGNSWVGSKTDSIAFIWSSDAIGSARSSRLKSWWRGVAGASGSGIGGGGVGVDGRDRSIGSTGGRATSGAPAGSTSTWGGEGLLRNGPQEGLHYRIRMLLSWGGHNTL